MPRTSFQIMISDEQRDLIAEALRALAQGDHPENEEIVTLAEMFEDLPSADADSPPNTLHGFCL